MKRPTSHSSSSDTEHFSLSGGCIASTISSRNLPTSASPPSTLQILQQQSSTQMVFLRSKTEVKHILSQSSRRLKELLDDELFWLFIKSKLERLHLRKCTFDPYYSVSFSNILKFLKSEHLSKSYFRFAFQFNDYITQWDLYDEVSNPC